MTTSKVSFDPFSDDFFNAPFATYRRMRDEAPVYYNEIYDFYALTRHEDVTEALKDHQTYSSSRGIDLAMVQSGQPVPPLIIMMDPPAHRRMRSLVNKVFTPRAIERQRQTVIDTIDHYLDAADPEHFDVVQDFSALFPVEVITEMLGVPKEQRQDVRLLLDKQLAREYGNIEMPEDLRAVYDRMEKEFFIQLDSGKQVEMFNQAALTNKCLQFANGAMYPVAGMPLWEPIHDLKLEALEEIIDEAQGQQVLCAYGYRSDAERIMKRFAELRPINLTECKTEAALTNAMARWASGDCPLMIGHPASMGHGIDGLQKRGHIVVWYGLNWSLDLYDQMNARIRRQGQGAPVICHRLMMLDTLDQAQAMALDEKAQTQAGLRNAVKQYRLTRGF
mgnify:CR=1 FL=1